MSAKSQTAVHPARRPSAAHGVPPRGRTLRINELARAAGLSGQQIRNYVDSGLLPPVERSASGYRLFTEDHAEALSVLQRMAEGHGWERTRSIMRAVHAGDVGVALCQLDRSHAELNRERAEMAALLASRGASLGAGGESAAQGGRRRLRIGEAADAVGVLASSLRLWERLGLLRPERERATGYRVFDETELHRARIVAMLRQGDYPIPVVRSALDELRAGHTPACVHLELTAREQDLTDRSLRRLRASATLYAYLDRLGLTRPPSASTS